jgi:CRP-like cAMP-binding protein
VSFKQGDVVLKEGQRNSCLYRIKSGAVRVEKAKSIVLGHLHKNQGNASVTDNSNIQFLVRWHSLKVIRNGHIT